jgi:ABC-2 type transport system permease protein
VSVARDTVALLGRWVIHLKRDVMSLSIGLMQPIFWLVLFGGVFRGFVRQRADLAGTFGDDYLSFYASGVVAFTILTNAVMGGIPLVFDRETGFIDRILSAPISRSAIVASRFIYVTGFSLLQGFVVLGVAWLMGVRFHGGVPAPVAILGVAFYGALLAMGITALSLALAFLAPAHHVFFSITGFLLTPFMFLSSAFVPLAQIPGNWRLVALANPLTHAIDPMRALICGADVVGGDPGYVSHAAILLGFDVICFALAVRVVRRRLD